MKEAINLTTYARIESELKKKKVSLQLISDRNKKKPIQAIILPINKNMSSMKAELLRWIHGYKIVKDCGDHFEEVNPCPVVRTTRQNADITLVYFKNQSFYKLPEGHRFLKIDDGKK